MSWACRAILLITAAFPVSLCHAEVVPLARSDAWADSTLSVLRNTLERRPQATISTTDLLVDIFSRRKDLCALSEVNGLRSTSFADLGALDSALACAHRALIGFRPGCDSLVLMRGQVALSYLYLKLKEYGRVDSIFAARGVRLRPSTGRPTAPTSTDGGAALPLRRLRPVPPPPATSARPGVSTVKKLIRRLIAWEVDPLREQIVRLQQASLRSAETTDARLESLDHGATDTDTGVDSDV